MMKPCPVFPVVGTITAVGPSMLDKGGVLYRYIEFREKGGRARHLTVVRAVEELAALIEQHAIGMFSVLGAAGRAPVVVPRPRGRAEASRF